MSGGDAVCKQERDLVVGQFEFPSVYGLRCVWFTRFSFPVTLNLFGAYRFRIRNPVIASGAKQSRAVCAHSGLLRSEEHTSELQSLMRISYAVFCLTKKKNVV